MATESHGGHVSDEYESNDDVANPNQPKQSTQHCQDTSAQPFTELERHIAHQIAVIRHTKSQLKERLQSLGHLPQGTLTMDQEKLWAEAFNAVLKKGSSNGWFELKDEMWERLSIDEYPYGNQKDMEKARKRRSKFAFQLHVDSLQDEASDTDHDDDAEDASDSAFEELKRHIAHQMAVKLYVKSQLMEHLQTLGLFPEGRLSREQYELREEAFKAICKKHPSSNGWYDLKDEIWNRVDVENYPYNNKKDREKARKRKLKQAPHLGLGTSQDEASGSVSKADFKRPAPGLSRGEPSQKRAKRDGDDGDGRATVSARATALQGQIAANGAADQNPKATESPSKIVKTKKCKVCNSENPYTTQFFEWRYVDEKLWVACRACLERTPTRPPFQNEKAGPSTAVSADGLTNHPETLESQEIHSSQDVGSTTPEPCSQTSNTDADNNAASRKCVEKLSAMVNKLSQENQVLRDDAIKSSTSLQLLQSENERLQAEVETLKADSRNDLDPQS